MTTHDETVHGTGFISSTLSISGGTPIDGSATLFHLDGERFGEMHSLVELAISDQALEGRAATPLSAGAAVSLGFEAPGTPARSSSAIPVARVGGSASASPPRPDRSPLESDDNKH